MAKDYPNWICATCGTRYGRKQCGIACWHFDTCNICGEETEVTQPRDYGHLRNDWAKDCPCIHEAAEHCPCTVIETIKIPDVEVARIEHWTKSGTEH
jgi:hypothetical protein